MLVTSTSPAGVTYEFDSCIACGHARGGADAYYCEVCLDNGATEVVLNDSPFFTSEEMREMEAEGEDPLPPPVAGSAPHPRRHTVLACGSRSWKDASRVRVAFSHLAPDSHLIHGAARGADLIAAHVAMELGWTIAAYPADWVRNGRSAGFRRNREMVALAPDLVIAFWDGRSPGTGHTIRLARHAGIPVEIVSASTASHSATSSVVPAAPSHST